MPRKWKNSDDNDVFADRANNKKLEQLRMELIPGYAAKKFRKNKQNQNFQKNDKNRQQNLQK